MEYKYGWNSGAPLAHLPDAQEFQDALVALERRNGRVTASLLASAAKDENHVAHAFVYHVNRKEAAQKHYEERARLLIRTHVVIPVENPQATIRSRVSVPAEADDGGSGGNRYIAAQEVAARPDLRDLHRKSLLRRMNLLRQELISFDEFTEIITAIDKVLDVEKAA